MSGPVSALVALAGSTTASAATALLAAAGDSGAADLAPWVQSGGSAAAVGGLVYVARLIIKGELVARPVRQSEAEAAAAIRAQGEREAKLLEVVAQQREVVLEQRADREATMRLLGKTEQQLEAMADLMREAVARRARDDRDAAARRRHTEGSPS